MSSIVIRNAHRDDFEAVFGIWLDSQQSATGINDGSGNSEIKEEMNLRLFARGAYLYVAEGESGEVIAWQAMAPLFTNPLYTRKILQSSTYVDKRFMNNDIGEQLFMHAFNAVRSIGIDQIY